MTRGTIHVSTVYGYSGKRQGAFLTVPNGYEGLLIACSVQVGRNDES